MAAKNGGEINRHFFKTFFVFSVATMWRAETVFASLKLTLLLKLGLRTT
jgi:hypothetical protein